MKENLLIAWYATLKFLDKHLFKIIGVLILVGFITYCAVLCDSKQINAWEQRLYVWMFFLLIIVIGFGVLRLYNAIVVNNSFLTTLTKQFTKLLTELVKLDQTINTNSQTHRTSHHATAKLSDHMKELIKQKSNEASKNSR